MFSSKAAMLPAGGAMAMDSWASVAQTASEAAQTRWAPHYAQLTSAVGNSAVNRSVLLKYSIHFTPFLSSTSPSTSFRINPALKFQTHSL